MKFTDILQDRNIDFKREGDHHHARYGWIQLDCPFCRTTGKYHMGYNLGGNYCNCWKCGSHSLTVVTVVLLGIGYTEAKKLLGGLVTETTAKIKTKRGTLKLPKGRVDLQWHHIDYLHKRGFDYHELVETWGIEAIGIAARLSWRIFIPIHYRAEIVSWTTRTTGGSDMRYISASAEEEALNHKDLLYGEDFVRHACCCVEGPFDAMRIGPGAVATCGVGYSRAQLLKLSKHPVRAVCFDSSKAAQKRANKLCDDLSAFPGDTFNITLKAEDPGCAGPKEIKGIRDALGL